MNKIIIVKIMGGLASQLHKYSIGRILADRYSCDLKLDLTWFHENGKGDTPREFMLENYHTRYEIASSEDIKSLKTSNFNRKLSSICNKINFIDFFMKPTHYIGGSFNENVLNCAPPVYIEGEWFGSKYLREGETRLRADFRLKQRLSHSLYELLSDIGSNISVAVHVRRGDFVKSETASKFHYSLSLEYYKRSIELIESKVASAKFYVFSDDYSWVCKNMNGLSEHIVFIPEHSPVEDMFLMSNCLHHIIANSGFSWFGAWLNNTATQIKIAPNKWIRNEYFNKEILADLVANGYDIVDAV